MEKLLKLWRSSQDHSNYYEKNSWTKSQEIFYKISTSTWALHNSNNNNDIFLSSGNPKLEEKISCGNSGKSLSNGVNETVKTAKPLN
jgi:hypothetical protein